MNFEVVPPSMNDVSHFLPQDVAGPTRANKDRRNRLTAYTTWLTRQNRSWLEPDLVAYRDFLIKKTNLSASSIKAHLSTIRGHYRWLIESGELEALLAKFAGESEQIAPTVAVLNIMASIEKAIDPEMSAIESSRPIHKQLRLTRGQAEQLRNKPDRLLFEGLRDAAIIDLLLKTGLRAAELCALTVSDLFVPDETDDNAVPTLKVPKCTGCTKRNIPIYDEEWVLGVTRQWLKEANIQQGYVFRSLWKSGRRIRNSKMSPRTVERIVEHYPIEVLGQEISVTPMVLRRTYASMLFRHGGPITEGNRRYSWRKCPNGNGIRRCQDIGIWLD